MYNVSREDIQEENEKLSIFSKYYDFIVRYVFQQ